MEGYHGTVFAYGMTGTGKTFSMQGTRDSPGVIPLAITDIFSYIRETPHREFLLRVSYLEIYNEKIHDLLSPAAAAAVGPGAPQPEEIKLREDNKRGVFAYPLKEEIVQSPTQLLRVIARGDQSRKTRSTQYNAQSSRSHAVVQIVVESRERAPAEKAINDKRSPLVPGGVRVSTLSMIDLAGSERAAENKERRTEGAHINKSLLTLGTVIARLSGDTDGGGTASDKDGKHLPYRDSKLTRLLQPALSGNSLVSILCTIQISSTGSVASANSHTGETLNTLKFAARAKNNIVSHAQKAEEVLGASGDGGSRVLLERYRMEIHDLKSQLEAQKKDQDQRVEAVDLEPVVPEDQRHEEQILEMHLARTALTRRMEDLKRLILDSRSTGVNNTTTTSGRTMSSLSAHPSLSMHHHKSESSTRTLRSLRSSASHSTLGRTTTPLPSSLSRQHSITSTVTINDKPSPESPISPLEEEEDDNDDDFFSSGDGDGNATSKARIAALHADLADKTRYIATLEKRLLQARRSSQSRASSLLLSSPRSVSVEDPIVDAPAAVLVREKDAEIAHLKARLEDKDRMVTALRSAARHRHLADPPAPSPSPSTVLPATATATSPSPFDTDAIDADAISPLTTTGPPPFPAPAPALARPTTPPKTTTTTTMTAAATSNESASTGRDGGDGSSSNGLPPPPPPTHKKSISPVQFLSPEKNKKEPGSKDAMTMSMSMTKRRSIDEMTRILDGMISDRIQTGNLVKGANGVIKPVGGGGIGGIGNGNSGGGIGGGGGVGGGGGNERERERRKESLGLGSVPSVGALALQLRPVSTVSVSEIGGGGVGGGGVDGGIGGEE